jgi:hypothetical protein
MPDADSKQEIFEGRMADIAKQQNKIEAVSNLSTIC